MFSSYDNNAAVSTYSLNDVQYISGDVYDLTKKYIFLIFIFLSLSTSTSTSTFISYFYSFPLSFSVTLDLFFLFSSSLALSCTLWLIMLIPLISYLNEKKIANILFDEMGDAKITGESLRTCSTVRTFSPYIRT